MLKPDRTAIAADGHDLAVVEVQIVDAAGRLVPMADSEVTFRLAGRGRIIGVGNGDPSSHEAGKAEFRRAFNGLCMAIVQSTREPGEIRIDAASPGLASGRALITSTASR